MAAVDICRDLGNQVYEAWVLLELAKAQTASRDPQQALDSYHQAAALYRQLRDPGSEAAALDGAGETCQVLGNLSEAADFHRSAVAILRTAADPWRLAVALNNLAAACQAETPDQAVVSRREALDLIADFSDPRATQLRQDIVGLLG